MNLAILGATGVVGREMIKVIGEYGIEVDRIELLASSRSAGTLMDFNGREVAVRDAESFDFKGIDYVLGAVENEFAVHFAPGITSAGAVFIDNSSAFRMDPDVPLVVPEINGEDAKKNHGIISNPNCSTIITMMAIAAIARLSPIKSMVASTYQAVSGAGIKGLNELEKQMSDIGQGREPQVEFFPVQIANNVIPFIGSKKDNLYTSEEMKLQNEGRKILHLPDMKVSCSCVRVPVMRSHSISVTLVTEQKITVEEANEAVRNFPGVRLVDDFEGRCYPTPLDTSNQDLVWVGRIREGLIAENSLTLWCCGDQIRKGAASNAVQILKSLLD